MAKRELIETLFVVHCKTWATGRWHHNKAFLVKKDAVAYLQLAREEDPQYEFKLVEMLKFEKEIPTRTRGTK